MVGGGFIHTLKVQDIKNGVGGGPDQYFLSKVPHPPI